MMTFRTDVFLVLAILHANIIYGLLGFIASLVVLVVENLPANEGEARDAGSIPGSERSPEKGMATHSSILAWRITWTEESGGLQSVESERVRHG